MQTPIQQSRGLEFISQNQKLHVQYIQIFMCIFSYRKRKHIIYQMWLSLGSEKIDDFPKCTVTHIHHLLPGKELVFLVSNSIFIKFRATLMLPSQELLLFWKFLLPYIETACPQLTVLGSITQFLGYSTCHQFLVSYPQRLMAIIKTFNIALCILAIVLSTVIY